MRGKPTAARTGPNKGGAKLQVQSALSKGRKVSRQDVARLAGVSHTTVSNVIGGRGYVTEAVRRRVLQAAEELDYCPNPIARSLSTKKAQQIAVLVENLSNPFFAEMLLGLTHVLNQAKLRTIVLQGTCVDDEYVGLLCQGLVDGVVVLDGDARLSVSSFERLRKKGVPIVAHGLEQGAGFTTVTPPFRTGMYEIMAYLKSLGHARIAFLSPDVPDEANARLIWYRAYRSELGLACEEALIVKSPMGPSWTMNAGYAGALELLSRNVSATALICANDLLAIGALKALNERRVPVPQAVSVVGWDGIEAAAYTVPGLTTFYVDPRSIAERLAQAIISSVSGQALSIEPVTGRLVIRDSTGPPGGSLAERYNQQRGVDD